MGGVGGRTRFVGVVRVCLFGFEGDEREPSESHECGRLSVRVGIPSAGINDERDSAVSDAVQPGRREASEGERRKCSQ